MHETMANPGSRSAADVVFDQLHDEIASLVILPGTKISEADVLDDHRAIADALTRQCAQDARELIRLHVARLDATIAEIHDPHTDYFQ